MLNVILRVRHNLTRCLTMQCDYYTPQVKNNTTLKLSTIISISLVRSNHKQTSNHATVNEPH